ncbi:hypothetical protein [Nocardioides daeguensis]|uniref:SAF domain-containing protein n=1 Tax=Nocardioides daeguensis TaxID=908359 RepID=A0ABP6V6F8_9ACTN|nr:hypothetical protein [Nocardioides daeguensis]MBV6729714.1 hypothetical protein [Nocardioides daeguensis]MCR1774681.1 hypothetical protein [Nocardioides daeguensis]
MRLRPPTPSFAVAVTALVVALGGTSYAAVQIGSADIRDGSVRSVDVRDGALRGKDLKNGTVRAKDLAAGVRKDIADSGRWLLVNAAGQIEAQSGGFAVAAAYPVLANTAAPPADNSLRAAGNVYISAGEDLRNNAIVTVIALQNQLDQNGDMITNGRAPGADANPEFAGEISASVCGLAGVVACAPAGTNTTSHFVVSPRNSDGSVTGPDARKRFYVVMSGDSSDRS